MRRYKGKTLEQKMVRSVGFPLAGGAALAGFVGATQTHWWAGPAVLLALVLAVLVLCRV